MIHKMRNMILIFLTLALLFTQSGCALAWFGAGAATGAVVHEAVDDDEKVVIVHEDKG
ncbi:MAG: hypothetical protein HY585_01025 [Candidatus Omnitrophica bacterium]|nr:hypothetical protein [Candidatus Omnitrophota bacterium]